MGVTYYNRFSYLSVAPVKKTSKNSLVLKGEGLTACSQVYFSDTRLFGPSSAMRRRSSAAAVAAAALLAVVLLGVAFHGQVRQSALLAEPEVLYRPGTAAVVKPLRSTPRHRYLDERHWLCLLLRVLSLCCCQPS